MSMINEQVKELRELAKYWKYNVPKKPIPQIFNEAADTMELLSAKLEVANKLALCETGWILCSEKYPENEKEVEITFIRKHWKTEELLYCTARAFYEDGTFNTEDSSFNWEDTDNWEYDEEKNGYVIPEGWWESVSFSEEFGAVDMPVVAWREIMEPYHEP